MSACETAGEGEVAAQTALVDALRSKGNAEVEAETMSDLVIPEELKSRAIGEWNGRCVEMIDWAQDNDFGLLDEGEDTKTLVGIDLAVELLQAHERIARLESRLRELEKPASGSFLIASFLEAMNDIGRYGFDKYGPDSFQARRLKGDTSRGDMKRCTSEAIGLHACEHFNMYLSHIAHDYFGTDKHQLAAVAFNAMMEFYFSGLAEETEPINAPSAAPAQEVRK